MVLPVNGPITFLSKVDSTPGPLLMYSVILELYALYPDKNSVDSYPSAASAI